MHSPVPAPRKDAPENSVRRELVAAVARRDIPRRNQLMVYAIERGVTFRQLCQLTGIASTSTVQDIVRHYRRGAVLDDPAPEANHG